MRTTGNRSASRALIVAARAALPLLAAPLWLLPAGCDKMEGATRQADRKVVESINRSEVDRQSKGEFAATKASEDLKSAAAVADASPAAKARANGLYAQDQFQKANALMREIEARQVNTLHDVWTLEQQAAYLSDTAGSIATGKQNEPKAGLGALDAIKTDVNGELTKIRADIERLQGEVAKRTGEIKTLTDEKTKTAGDAEALVEKSGAAKGKESVDLFQQATAARQKAGALAAQIDSATVALAPFQQDLDRALAQAKSREATLATLDAQKKQLQDGWAAQSTQIKGQGDDALKIIDERIKPKGEALAKAVAETEDLRSKAEVLLKSAITHYADAGKAAKQLADTTSKLLADEHFRDSPSKKAWEALSQTYNVNTYRLEEGRAEQALATLHADKSRELAARLHLANSLKAAADAVGGTVPETLAANDLEAKAKAATAESENEYDAAQKTLDTVANATLNAQEEAAAAKVSRMFTLFGLYLVNNKPEQLAAAQEAHTAIDRNTPLPMLPIALGGAVKDVAPSAAPTTAPAATQPTEGTIPPAAPTTPDAGTPAAPAVPAVPAVPTTPAPDATTPAPAAPATPAPAAPGDPPATPAPAVPPPAQ